MLERFVRSVSIKVPTKYEKEFVRLTFSSGTWQVLI